MTAQAGLSAPRETDEQGSVSLWLLGLCLVILAVGGISLDLWRGFSDRRALAGLADGAAAAGAAGVDLVHYRATGETRLDADLAVALATDYLARYPLPGPLSAPPAVWADAERVTVVAESAVELTLLRLLAPGAGPLRVRVVAAARPGPLP